MGQYSKPDYICVCPNVLLWFAAGATGLVEVVRENQDTETKKQSIGESTTGTC